MPKPSIADAVIPAHEREEKQIVKELTVLQPDAENSIFSLIFTEKKGDAVENEQ